MSTLVCVVKRTPSFLSVRLRASHTEFLPLSFFPPSSFPPSLTPVPSLPTSFPPFLCVCMRVRGVCARVYAYVRACVRACVRVVCVCVIFSLARALSRNANQIRCIEYAAALAGSSWHARLAGSRWHTREKAEVVAVLVTEEADPDDGVCATCIHARMRVNTREQR